MRVLAVMLLASCALAGCSREITRQQVAEFVDRADEAARKRFAPEICDLRGKDFTMHQVFHAEGEDQPSEMEITRKLYCQQAGSFSRLRQYRLERKSIDIDIATDRKSATVTAEYVETMPYYDPWRSAATPDDFNHFQVVQSHDVSVVGREDGDLKFLSTTTEARQSLVPKKQVQIPYD